MARRQLRIKPFTRFVLFMIIVVPLAYFGIMAYQGEDGLKRLQDLFENNTTKPQPTMDTETMDLEQQIQKAQEEVEATQNEIQQLHEEINTLKKELEEQRARVEQN